MPTNEVEVRWPENGGLEAKVWDNLGVEHDVSSVFQHMHIDTGVGQFFTKIVLSRGVDCTLELRPKTIETKIGVGQAVVDQILQLLE